MYIAELVVLFCWPLLAHPLRILWRLAGCVPALLAVQLDLTDKFLDFLQHRNYYSTSTALHNYNRCKFYTCLTNYSLPEAASWISSIDKIKYFIRTSGVAHFVKYPPPFKCSCSNQIMSGCFPSILVFKTAGSVGDCVISGAQRWFSLIKYYWMMKRNRSSVEFAISDYFFAVYPLSIQFDRDYNSKFNIYF